ncbi:MAG: DUF4440 domain-containing protein [Gammaproteobacteria bacterium]|nr:DUF4440 domain-containing protein [Gammaproteobacteria bacterium]
MHPEQAAIIAVHHLVAATFSALDLPRFRQCYRLPCQMITSHGVSVATTDAEFEAFFQPLMETLRCNDFGRSELREIHVRVQADNIAIVSTHWVRYRKNGSELEQLGATYTMTKSAGEWRIVSLMAHEPAAMLRLDHA